MSPRLIAIPLLLLPFGPRTASAQEVLLTRVVDVGAGLCTVTIAPGDSRSRIMVYDAGHWQGHACRNAVRETVLGDTIDVLVLSHSDADHLGDADDILKEKVVKLIVRTGFRRDDTGNWRNANNSIGDEAKQVASVINLGSLALPFGQALPLGDATITFIAGWHRWTLTSGLSDSERRNAVSIVGRLDYDGRSILFGGDTVGRRIGDPDTACRDAEAEMVNGSVSLTADVLIAPHHGADNASSGCFIDAVDPQFVIFSAGHDHGHPREAAAQRYLDHGVPLSSIFRTDRGDDEEDEPDEWKHLSVPGCRDGRADDDVDVFIIQGGGLLVGYRDPSASGC